MTPERWRQVTGVFDDALARDAEARGPFLDEICAGDEALRQERRWTPDSNHRSNGERPILAFPEDAVDAGTDLGTPDPETVSGTAAAGTKLGAYRIERLLGRGGMGVVEKDPTYALAHLRIRQVWGQRQQFGVTPPREAAPRMKAALSKALELKALELDDTRAVAHYALADQARTEWDWLVAITSAAPNCRVTELDPLPSPEYVSTACYHTYMRKLTLSVDEKVVRGAKRYAAARGTSVSRLVERYLDLLSKPPKSDDQTPVLRMLRGAGRGVPADAHRRHLSRKYR